MYTLQKLICLIVFNFTITLNKFGMKVMTFNFLLFITYSYKKLTIRPLFTLHVKVNQERIRQFLIKRWKFWKLILDILSTKIFKRFPMPGHELNTKLFKYKYVIYLKQLSHMLKFVLRHTTIYDYIQAMTYLIKGKFNFLFHIHNRENEFYTIFSWNDRYIVELQVIKKKN